MGTSLRILILSIGLVFNLAVIYLLVKKKMNEKLSLLWLLGCLIILIFSFFPLTLDRIAEIVGVDYPPTLLFTFSTIILLLICLMNSVKISILNTQIKELTQQVLIKNHENQDKMNSSSKAK